MRFHLELTAKDYGISAEELEDKASTAKEGAEAKRSFKSVTAAVRDDV